MPQSPAPKPLPTPNPRTSERKEGQREYGTLSSLPFELDGLNPETDMLVEAKEEKWHVKESHERRDDAEHVRPSQRIDETPERSRKNSLTGSISKRANNTSMLGFGLVRPYLVVKKSFGSIGKSFTKKVGTMSGKDLE